MNGHSESHNPWDHTEARFEQTQWTVVMGAAHQSVPGADQALEKLCGTYWPPLYAFLRKRGRSSEEAKDLVQGFFAHLLSKSSRLENIQPSKGKFRSFLLASLNNYLLNERDIAIAQKRGGGNLELIPIQTGEDETVFGVDPGSSDTPDKAYDRCWAFTVINRALQQLKEASAANGESAIFDLLHPFLVGDAERGAYREIAAQLGKEEGATRVIVHRLKSDFRQMLRAQVARTVADSAQIESEIRDLLVSTSGA